MMPQIIRDSRLTLEKSPWGTLRQGVLFCGAAADGYSECEVHGLIITAQCDLAQEKVSVVNFLPVVKLRDWLARDFANILVRRLQAQIIGGFKNLLKEAGHSPSILETEPIENIVSTLLSDESTKAASKRTSRAQERLAEFAFCSGLLAESVISPSQLEGLRGVDKSAYNRLLSELFKNQLSGYYFIPAVDPTGVHSGFVVLLRQIYHLPYLTALSIVNGMSPREQRDSDPTGMSLVRLDYSEGTFAMPVGMLTSPFREHLMQAFAILYSRIGIQDLEESYMEQLQHSANETEESA